MWETKSDVVSSFAFKVCMKEVPGYWPCSVHLVFTPDASGSAFSLKPRDEGVSPCCSGPCRGRVPDSLGPHFGFQTKDGNTSLQSPPVLFRSLGKSPSRRMLLRGERLRAVRQHVVGLQRGPPAMHTLRLPVRPWSVQHMSDVCSGCIHVKDAEHHCSSSQTGCVSVSPQCSAFPGDRHK